MVGDLLAELLEAAQKGRATSRTAAKRIMIELRKDDGINNSWFSEPEQMRLLFQALLTGLPAGRGPGDSAVPSDGGLGKDTLTSHPQAMSWRMRQVQATPAGRAFLRLMPSLAMRMPSSKASASFAGRGIHHRDMSHLFAATLSHPIGQQTVRQAAYLAQQTFTRKFWDRPMAFVPRIVVGSGPTAMSLAHSFFEAGDVGSTLYISANEWAGGPFGWGSYQVNHRTRPPSPELRDAPATLGTLDGFGPGPVAPNDLTGTWAYNISDSLAATAALNALSAGPVVTAELVKWDNNPLSGMASVQLRHPVTGDILFVETADLVIAPGLGIPRTLPGSARSLSVKDLLQHSDLHRIGDRVMVVGEADSACIAIEEILNLWNRTGVSRGEHQLREIVWIRPSGQVYKETYNLEERNRYAGRIADFLPRLTDPNYPSVIKVVPGRVVNTIQLKGCAAITIESSEGGKTIPFRGAIINTTGFENPFAAHWTSPDDGVFCTDDGFPVARQLGRCVTIVGPGAGLPVSDLELSLFPILREPALGRVNPVALFRNNLAAELLARARAYVGDRSDSNLRSLRPRRSQGRSADVQRESLLIRLPPVDTSMAIKGDLESLLRIRLGSLTELVKGVPFDKICLLVTFDADGPVLQCVGSTKVLNQVVLQPLFSDPEVQRILSHQLLTRREVASGLAVFMGEPEPDVTVDIVIPVSEGRLMTDKLSIV